MAGHGSRRWRWHQPDRSSPPSRSAVFWISVSFVAGAPCESDRCAGGDHGGGQKPDRCQDKTCWNTGLHGARENHWLRLRFSGVSDIQLVAVRVEVREPQTRKLLRMCFIAANDSHKSGCPLEAHVRLGKQEQVDLVIAPPGVTRPCSPGSSPTVTATATLTRAR